MDENSIVRINGKRITAPLAITQKIKKEEITGGFIKDEDGNVLKVGNAKLRKIKWLVKKLDGPLVTFCKFLHEVRAVRKLLSPVTGTIRTLHGGVKDTKDDKARTQLLERFQDGGIDHLICQLRTGGVSIELTKASNLIFFSMNHSFIDFSQIIARLHRYGQTREVNVWLIYGINTVDEEIIDVVDKKNSSVYRVISHFENGDLKWRRNPRPRKALQRSQHRQSSSSA
jgi:superfamily II DNA or RNA helicase